MALTRRQLAARGKQPNDRARVTILYLPYSSLVAAVIFVDGSSTYAGDGMSCLNNDATDRGLAIGAVMLLQTIFHSRVAMASITRV